MSIEDIKAKYKLGISTISFPVRYDDFGQKIWDKNNNLILDIRGWGRIQYLTEPEKRQDEIGNMLTDLLNSVM